MRRYATAGLASVMILAAVGCQRPRDVFKAQRPWEKRITVDSAAGRPDGQALPVVAERPDSLKYGFKIIYQGRGEIHLYDEQDRHTGPATAGEYLPTVEALLKQPGLHDQERSNLENVKAKIIRTGSAAEFATTRQIPNLHYQKDAGGLRAEYKGAGELTLQVKPGEAGGESLSLQLWNDRVLRTARYDLPADNGVGQLSLSALMEDFSLSWDSNGDGRDDRDLEPSRLDSTVMAD